MANYRVIGADLMEYGPVSAEQIRQWITEGRVDAETKLQAEGTAAWKPLGEVPEFAAASKGNGSRTCPKCGEPFEDGFDSCWKCGTSKDGSPAKEWTPVEAAAEEVAEPCPKCGSTNLSRGELLPCGRGSSVMFKPEGTRIFLSLHSHGVDLSSGRSFACLDCGLVWDYLRPDELKEFISNHCRGSENDDAYALLSEAARLESKGDIAGALAKYEAVRQGFQGTGAARDAESGILSLKENYESSARNDDPYALLSEADRLESKGDIPGALAKYEAVKEKFPGTEAARDAEASIRSLKEISG